MASEICTTREAAQILGVSVTQVQQLVEQGILDAWKTSGGHRRIPIEAVHRYKARGGKQAVSGLRHDGDEGRLRIMIVEDNPLQQELYRVQVQRWALPVDLVQCTNGYQALLDLPVARPDVLLVDVVMEGMDGYALVKSVLTNGAFAEVEVAIVSQESREDIEQRGGLPPGVAYFPKPVVFDELRGYLIAQCARKARLSVAR